MSAAWLSRRFPDPLDEFDAPASLRDILDPARGAVEPPIRAEIFGPQRFAQHGRSLGATHRAKRLRSHAATFFPRLRSNIRALREAHRYIGEQARTGYDISPAAEWLLDNFHLIEAQLEQVHEGLPRDYFRALPVLHDEPLAGLPRIYGVAWAFVAHTDGAFDEDLLAHFLLAYQEARELHLSEIWALPTTLRVVLIENLRRLAERVATNKAARELANLCCDRIESTARETLDVLLARLERRGVGRVFLAQMHRRLNERGGRPAEAADVAVAGLADVGDWLARALPDAAAAHSQHSADQAADNLSVSNAVTALRVIGNADWPDIVGRTSTLMRLMLGSPVFEAEHATTRDQTLHGIELLAERSGRSETQVAQALLDLMRGEPAHDAAAAPLPATADRGATQVAGHWLDGAGRPALLRALGLHEPMASAWRRLRGGRSSAGWRQRLGLWVYLGSVGLGTLGLVAVLLPPQAGMLEPGSRNAAWLALATLLMLFPASEAVVAVINRLISESARPQHLPRLALAQGIPPEHRVLVVVPALLTGPAATAALAHRLRLHHLANVEAQVQFALLTDWVDAETEQRDDDAARLAEALAQIDELNAQHPAGHGEAPRFILLHRRRSWSETEQRWIGWERKRGKLEQLLASIVDGHSSAFVDLGQASRLLDGVRYVVTLDSDTHLPPGRLRELVGVAAHPHNQPRLDASGRRVEAGYAILQPRIVTPLPQPHEMTRYHALFAGQCGIDPYSAATSEVYQDLFGEGSYTGKGLLHVRAMHAVLGGRLPEGQVLSHDLLEGCIARCAALTDVTLIEDAPFHADVAASRVHRWTRGDWQLLPFLFSLSRWPLRAVHRWKMFDNLRRSLVAPMSLGLLLLALGRGVVSPWAMLVLVFAAFSAGPLMGAVAGFSPSRDDLAKLHFYRQAGIDFARALLGGLWLVAQLVQQALLAGDAVLRALVRLAVSRRHLLEWTTAAAAQASARTELGAIFRNHAAVSAASLGLLLGLVAVGSPTPWLAAGLCAVWALSPVWTWWVSRPLRPEGEARLSGRASPFDAAVDTAYLEGVARDTWRYFERVVTAPDHHLPPDNLQTAPHDMLAHRTSPTNIGLYLLSAACARSFGWIGTQELVARLRATLGTLQKLPRHRGHFLNWYDTQTLAPLLPMYVSTVDSGNLAGHLLAVAQACRELAHAPHDPHAAARAIAASRRRLDEALRRRAGPAAARAELRWLIADHRATRRSADLDAAAAGHGDEAIAAALRALAAGFEQLAWEADYAFLYHRKRHLFHIGYRVAEQQLDASFYDLLASESRLTSLLAIAKGDVPVRHWASLGRPFFAVGADAGLRSWSGSMFEYLMPSLALLEPQGSVLRQAGHAAVREQIAFTRAQRLPWGISESAYAGSDHTLAYQYAPQGVPRLALRRTPPDELVIAPYATALALLSMPREACQNFAALEALGARGRHGFIEALDFTPARQAGDEAFTRVQTFMAHHQGMSIVAIANLLHGGVAQRWGMAHPRIEAVASLLHERAPREVLALHAAPPGAPQQALARRLPGLQRQIEPGSGAIEPTHLLSNGRYSVALRANGAGWSRWGASAVTRSRDDALRDAHGSFFYLRREPGSAAAPRLASITQHPAPDPDAHYQSTYHADRVCFDAMWPDLQAHTTVWVSPEDDIEFRRVELRNHSDRSVELELISTFDVVLADPRADEAHPAFSNLFVRAEWQAASQALVFARLPRLATERGLHAAHFLAASDAQVLGLRVQTDRQRWLGRNGSASRPLALLDSPFASDDARAEGQDAVVQDTGLDPVCALGVRVRIAARGKLQLTFATAASNDAGTLRAVIDKYRQPSHVERASLMSATLTGIRVRALQVSPESFAAIQMLTTALVSNLARLGAKQLEPASDVCDRRLLWRFGISGDRPIVLVFAGATQGLGLLRSLAQALRQWSFGGVACDLVVVNGEPSSYLMPVHHDIAALRERHIAETAADPTPQLTGLHLLRTDELSNDELATLQHLARVRLQADGRPLAHHVQEWSELHELAWQARREGSAAAVALAPARTLAPAVAAGHFGGANHEFRFEVHAGKRPLRPWINVLANPGFGAQISEAGGGYTWARNSRLHQLTPWSNDPVADPPGEHFLLQDRKTMHTWSVVPSAAGDAQASYRITHRQGSTAISHRQGELEVTALWCVDAESSVKQVSIQIVNRGHRSRSLRAIGIAEWVMGAQRGDRSSTRTAAHTQALAPQPGASTRPTLTTLLCTQLDRSAGFGGSTAFLALASDAPGDRASASTSALTCDWTCDRRECFDARGRAVVPDVFGQRAGLGLDPCAALSKSFTVAAGETVECVFLLGHAGDAQAATRLAAASAGVGATRRLERVSGHWDRLLGAATVSTPDPLFDAMVNRWLLYQTISSRLWAKAGFYQAGGATGFRDQLQDAMALAWTAPDMLRTQIVLCASRQFPQGDVQHWWHAPGGAGVRTHFSDDLLWLPFALAHYLRASGDAGLLDEAVPFIDGIAVPEGAEDAYYEPRIAAEMAPVYEHAARSIDRSLRIGRHGLPLMGSGDWNDGMNRVGHEGRGESVWLAWFLCRVVAEFAPLARARGEAERANRWEQAAQGWRAALATEAWDGAWFKRAFFDDGSALGSQANAEARIDLIAQAWAVLSGAADAPQQARALESMDELLVNREAGLIRLLDPPLAQARPSAGYIQAYPPGVRENGGQYSHAGVWALMAQARAPLKGRAVSGPSGPSGRPGSSGRSAPGGATVADETPGDAAYRYFTYLSPAHRAAHRRHGPAYGIEPYVMAGDVYSQPPYVGRGGWSWYTGAAAWLHRAAIESIFGVELSADTLRVRPCLPSHWPVAELTLRRDGRVLRLVLVRALPAHALQAAEPWCGGVRAVVLPAGELLRWRELEASACIVVAWTDAAPTRPSSSDGGAAAPEPVAAATSSSVSMDSTAPRNAADRARS